MADYDFGNRLTDLRIANGYSQFQLGRLTGVTDKAVSKWETGQSKPRLGVCKKLAAILGVSLDLLLNGKADSQRSEKKEKKEELWQNVRTKLYEKFGPEPPAMMIARFESEKIALEESDFIIHLNAMAKLVDAVIPKELPFFTGCYANESFAAWLLNVNAINPLPPYTHCPHCHYTQIHPEVRDGWDLAEEVCPNCGAALERDGHAIPFAEFTYRINHEERQFYPVCAPGLSKEQVLSILNEAYRDIYHVQPYTETFRGKPLPTGKGYFILPIGYPLPDLDENGVLAIEARDLDKDLYGCERYPKLIVQDQHIANQEILEDMCRKYGIHVTLPMLQSADVYRACWDGEYRRNPRCKVFPTGMVNLPKIGEPDTTPDLEPETHTIEWKDIADLCGDTPVSFTKLVKATELYLKGDWEETYKTGLKNGHFTLDDIPTDPRDVYKKLLSLQMPDAAIGMDFIVKIIVEIRDGKYLREGMDAETKSLLRSMGLQDWYIDFIAGIDSLNNHFSIYYKVIEKLTATYIEMITGDYIAQYFEMLDISMMNNRMCVPLLPIEDNAKEEMRGIIKKAKDETDNPGETLAMILKLLNEAIDDEDEE